MAESQGFVYVSVVRWAGDGVSRPEVLVGRDERELTRRTAQRLWEATAMGRGFPGSDGFLAAHPAPSRWVDDEAVDAWLEALEATPDAHRLVPGMVRVPDDTPGRDRDLGVALVGDPVGGGVILADFDQVLLERDVAVQLLDLVNRTPDLPAPSWLPDLADPRSVNQWLDHVRDTAPAIRFSIHQAVLPASATAPGGEAPAPVVDAPVEDVGVTDGGMWAGAVFPGGDPTVEPVLLVDRSRADLLARIGEQVAGTLGGDPARAGFLAGHPVPAGWDDPGQVEAWLAAAATAGVARWSASPVVSDGAPDADGWLFATALTGPEDREVADRLEAPPMGEAAARFLAEHGRPQSDHETVIAWLNAFAAEFDQPTFHEADVRLPPEPQPATPAHALVGHAPTGDGLAVGVMRIGGWDSHVQVVLGADVAQVRRQVARRLVAEIHTRSYPTDARQFVADHAHPDLLGDDQIVDWLEAFGREVAHPQAFVATGVVLPDAMPDAGVGVPGWALIRTDRATDWEALSQGDIPDMLIGAFPAHPMAEDFTNERGGLDRAGFDGAVEDWMDETLDLATLVADLPALVERRDELEYLRDRLARLVATGLPPEPVRGDFAVVNPAYLGEHDDLAFRWRHRQWQADFADAARNLEQGVRRLVAQTGGGCPDPDERASTTRRDSAPPRSSDPNRLPGGFPFTPATGTPGRGLGL